MLKKNKCCRLFRIRSPGVRMPALLGMERVMTMEPDSACCDCKKPVDIDFAKCPRCGARRCRACDDKTGAIVIQYMIMVGSLPPIDAEYCGPCFAATA